MSTGIDLSGYSPDTLRRMVAALEELQACLDTPSPSTLPFSQFRELLQLWEGLGTDEGRQGALAALRAFVRGRCH